MRYYFLVFALFCMASGLLSEELPQQTVAYHNQLDDDSLTVNSSSDSMTALLPLTGIQDENSVADERLQIDKQMKPRGTTDLTNDDSNFNDASVTDNSAQNAFTERQTLFVVVLIFMAAILLITLYYGFSMKCKRCGRMWAGKEIHSSVLKTWMSTKNVKRTDIIRDKNGQQTGTIEREESVPVSYSDVMHQYKCRHCGALWTKVKTHEN